jgi:hypothetical protein
MVKKEGFIALSVWLSSVAFPVAVSNLYTYIPLLPLLVYVPTIKCADWLNKDKLKAIKQAKRVILDKLVFICTIVH